MVLQWAGFGIVCDRVNCGLRLDGWPFRWPQVVFFHTEALRLAVGVITIVFWDHTTLHLNRAGRLVEGSVVVLCRGTFVSK